VSAWAGTGTQPVREPYKNRFRVFGLAHLPHQGQSGALPLNPAGALPRDHYYRLELCTRHGANPGSALATMLSDRAFTVSSYKLSVCKVFDRLTAN